MPTEPFGKREGCEPLRDPPQETWTNNTEVVRGHADASKDDNNAL